MIWRDFSLKSKTPSALVTSYWPFENFTFLPRSQLPTRNFLLALWKFHHSVYRMIMYWLYRRSEYYSSINKVIETRAGRLLKRRLWEAEFRGDFLLAILKFHRSYRMSVYWSCKKSEYFFKLDGVMEMRVDCLIHSLTPWIDDDIFQIFPWN